MKKLLVIFLLFATNIISSGAQRADVYKIDAEKNAYFHNNVGIVCVDEKNYLGAIQEFKIAIALNPNTQATSVYYNNLGDVYMKIGLYKYAQDCYERAITQYSLNFQYYQNLAKSFKAQKIVDSKIKFYSSREKKSLNMMMLGLLYVEKGDIHRGIIKLDEFCMQEPELIITGAVKNYINGLVTKN